MSANGSYGKLGSPYSVLYAPELMIQVTITGQLFLLMCIERMEQSGVRVVSANTDGFVSKVPNGKLTEFNANLFDLQIESGLDLEETNYKALHSRDVNSYVAITTKGEVKLKGAFSPCGPGLPAANGMKKNPTAQIAVNAAVALLSKGVPIEETIKACTDVRQFVVVRRVTGGCDNADGNYIGKVVRWYYSTEQRGRSLTRTVNGNTVGRSHGAMPLLTLPPENVVPEDMDFDWYIREAYAILQDVGFAAIDPAIAGRSGMMLARLPGAKNLHKVDAATGEALCGTKPKSIREPWVEFTIAPIGHRHCPKCRKANEL